MITPLFAPFLVLYPYMTQLSFPSPPKPLTLSLSFNVARRQYNSCKNCFVGDGSLKDQGLSLLPLEKRGECLIILQRITDPESVCEFLFLKKKLVCSNHDYVVCGNTGESNLLA